MTFDTDFDVRSVSLDALNSMTKYPSIPTYHQLDPRNGNLLEVATDFGDEFVILREKIDGTNSRIILLPDGEYILGSREELLYAHGDLLGNPAMGIVAALRDKADSIVGAHDYLPVQQIVTIYVETYGGKVTAASKQYGTDKTGYRLFDVGVVSNHEEVMSWELPKIASWREAGGPTFMAEKELASFSSVLDIALAPSLGVVEASTLPKSIDDMNAFLLEALPRTLCELSTQAMGEPDVIRSLGRFSDVTVVEMSDGPMILVQEKEDVLSHPDRR